MNYKKAYPIDNSEPVTYHRKYDQNKWLQAVQTISKAQKENIGLNEVIKQITADWSENEIYSFKNWLRFYQEGGHLKYAKAQSNWYQGSDAAPGYFFSYKNEPQTTTSQQIDFNQIRDKVNQEHQNRELAIKQKKKVISRLDSLEKLIRSYEGELLADQEYDSIMEAIYSLKKKINSLNKKRAATRVYDDLIIRESNVLNRLGFKKAAQLLYSTSQAAEPSSASSAEPSSESAPAIESAPPAPPGAGSGAPGGQVNAPGAPTTPPDTGGGTDSNQPASIVEKPSENDKAIKGFLENIGEDKLSASDDLFVEEDYDDLFTEAQVTTETPAVETPAATPATVAPTEAPIEVEEPQETLEVAETPEVAPAPPPAPEAKGKDFDAIINNALGDISVEDVIAKLEDLVNIFKIKEIPRQLSLIDMLLNKLGMSSFFPELSEAHNKMLEANGYVLSRLISILSRLQGAIKTHEIDLSKEQPVILSPEAEGIKKTLETEEEKNLARKEMRKQLEDQKLESATKETPEIEVEEDLGAPTAESAQAEAPAPPVPAPAPAPAKAPIPPPAR